MYFTCLHNVILFVAEDSDASRQCYIGDKNVGNEGILRIRREERCYPILWFFKVKVTEGTWNHHD